MLDPFFNIKKIKVVYINKTKLATKIMHLYRNHISLIKLWQRFLKNHIRKLRKYSTPFMFSSFSCTPN